MNDKINKFKTNKERYEAVLLHLKTDKSTIEDAVKKVGLTRCHFYQTITEAQRIELKRAKMLNTKYKHPEWSLYRNYKKPQFYNLK